MATSFIAAATGNTGGSSALTVSTVMPGAAIVGDLAICAVSAERGLVPSLTSSGWTVLDATADTTRMASTVAWKRLTAGDLGTLTAQVETARRMAITVAVIRGGQDLVAGDVQVGAFVTTGTSTTTAAFPGITPTAGDALLVAVGAMTPRVEPYQRTWTPGSGWTERANTGTTSATAINAYSYCATRQVSGGSGVSQTGMTITCSDSQFEIRPVTVSVRPSANVAPTADAGTDQVVTAGTTVTLDGTRSTDDVAVTGYAWTQVSGPTVTLTGAATSRPTFTAPAAGSTCVFQLEVTDAGALTDTDTVTVHVQTSTARPETLIGNPGAWTTGAASIPAALADESDSSTVVSPASPVDAAFTVDLPALAPGTPTVSIRAALSSATPVIDCLVELLQGTTVIASWAETLTTTLTTYEHTLTSVQAAAITDRTALRLRVTAG